jgi:hypothetical protein
MFDFLELILGGFDCCSLMADDILRELMSFHTSRVVIRPAGSDGVKASSLRVRFRFSFSKLAVSITVRAWWSSSATLAIVSWVLVGWGSGPPVGGSAIRSAVSSRSVHNAADLYHNSINHVAFFCLPSCYCLYTVDCMRRYCS